MTIQETVNGELSMGLKLLAFKPVKLELAPIGCVENAMKAEGWEAISDLTPSGKNGTLFTRYFYSSMQKSYAQVVCDAYTGGAEVKTADETEMLQSMSFEELKHLGNLIDKKSVALIGIYAEKELASAKTEEELKALNARNERMIAEAEVALRKR